MTGNRISGFKYKVFMKTNYKGQSFIEESFIIHIAMVKSVYDTLLVLVLANFGDVDQLSLIS